MRELGLILDYLYPEEFGVSYEVKTDVATGQLYVSFWRDALGPQPIQTELDAALLEVRREQKREEIAASGRSVLAGSGARNLDEAQIAAIGMSDELNRYQPTAERKAQLEAALDGLQGVRSRWNTLLGKLEAAETHAELDAIHWEMTL